MQGGGEICETSVEEDETPYGHGGAGIKEDDEAEADMEGRTVARQLARNMVFLMRSIRLGRQETGLPEEEPRAWTNFIR